MLRVLALLPLLACTVALAAPPDEPDLPDGTDKALKQIPALKPPPGMKVELFAAEPKLGSPVAIGLDEQNRVYVCEEYRFNRGTQENRSNPALKTEYLLDDDLQIRTLDDRLALFKKWQHKFPGGMDWFTKHADQLRMLEDTTGSGRADKSTIIAKFHAPLDGLCAGVLARDGELFVTCIPSLRRIRTGTDTPEDLLTGFGVNCAFLGHDLHGLVFGPDGKLYFSVGDRGFHVKTKEGTTLSGPRTGAIFRCNPDGTELEVIHRGLRNPQELAFDQYGNLFADDNNCDKGDHARLVYVVEDGESGWNMAYQTITPHTAAPWFAERLWHLPHPGQPAYIVPPVGKIGTGPSGFTFTSGTSLADRYKNSFLMCNFAGGRGIEAFKVKPQGAGFEIEDYHDFLTPIMATDCEFGYDGKLYMSDFIGLDWTGKSLGGRVYTVFDPAKLKSPVVVETKKLFAEGFDKLGAERLIKLLGHPDQRVRQRAQFRLVELKEAPLLQVEARTSKDQLVRLHAIWGLEQLARKWERERDVPNPTVPLIPLLADADPEVRTQSAKVLGDRKVLAAAKPLLELLRDDSPRVKFFAAQSLGKLKHKPAVGPLFAVLKANADADPFLRHACVAALARIGDADGVAAKASDHSASVRLAVVLVQRRLRDQRIVGFLDDPDPLVRTEAARAVHDLPMEEFEPALATRLAKYGEKPTPDGDPLVRRAISANYRLGGPAHAKAVLAAATNPNFSLTVRAEAVAALKDWSDPPPRDRVTGFWRPLPKRHPAVVRGVVEAGMTELLAKTSGQLQADAIGLVVKVGAKADPATFVSWATDKAKEPGIRVAALRFLAGSRSKALDDVLLAALADASAPIRAEARDLFAKEYPSRGAVLYAIVAVNARAPVVERQRAIAGLVALNTPAAGAALDALGQLLVARELPLELQLDVIEALKAAPAPAREKQRSAFLAQMPQGPVGKNRPSLYGGDAERGRDLFFNNPTAQCVRCHTVGGIGSTAGPELTKVAADPAKTREHFLESMLLPNAKIAPGFGSVTLTLIDGRTVAGVLAAEDKASVTVRTPEGKTVKVPVDDIEKRSAATSAMPTVEGVLTPRELRDLVEFLTTLK